MEYAPVEMLCDRPPEIIQEYIISDSQFAVNPPSKLSRTAIRTSLKASTWDGVFAAIFTSITGGVLLSNFLLELGANAMEIGMLSSIPMLVNLLQPLGAYLSEQTTSRRWYGMWIYGPSRSLWLILALGIGWNCWHHTESHALAQVTLGIILATNFLGALGSASWLSWMAVLVPVRLRGRYFGIRNSAANLTNLIGIPLLALAVSAWPGGTIQGYGIILLVGLVAGLISIGFQFFMMTDVNPQAQLNSRDSGTHENKESAWKVEPNFLKFLLYVGCWAFAFNVGSPFFNLYMLDNLAIDVRWVTLYNSLLAGASLLMLVVWGKIADRIGNRPVLILVGVVVALAPLLWLGTGNNSVSLWVWLPLLSLLSGGSVCAIELCNNNIQMAIAQGRNQSTYFALAAAVAGVSGALGTTLGGFLAQYALVGGLPALFAISALLRLIALLPLLKVREERSLSLAQVMLSLLPVRSQLVPIPAPQLASRSQ